MNSVFFFVACAGLIIYVGYLFWRDVWLEWRRTDEIAQVAKKLALRYAYKGRYDLIEEIRQFPMCSWGYSRRFTNVVSGNFQGADITSFDYWYTTWSISKVRLTRVQTVTRIDLRPMSFPDFSLRPERIMDAFPKWLGFRDINFESHPQFSRHYLLQGTDEVAIRKLFHPSVIKFFEEKRPVCVETVAWQLIVFRRNQRSKPNELEWAIEFSVDVMRQLARNYEHQGDL